mmetsp:Transcript_35802/g.114699  ORF Transcript_35802/g.114699 Transcript_35802/m.114699 type:complete len:295 (-) Transcript_35802:63-947(-)
MENGEWRMEWRMEWSAKVKEGPSLLYLLPDGEGASECGLGGGEVGELGFGGDDDGGVLAELVDVDEGEGFLGGLGADGDGGRDAVLESDGGGLLVRVDGGGEGKLGEGGPAEGEAEDFLRVVDEGPEESAGQGVGRAARVRDGASRQGVRRLAAGDGSREEEGRQGAGDLRLVGAGRQRVGGPLELRGARRRVEVRRVALGLQLQLLDRLARLVVHLRPLELDLVEGDPRRRLLPLGRQRPLDALGPDLVLDRQRQRQRARRGLRLEQELLRVVVPQDVQRRLRQVSERRGPHR